MLGLRHTHPDEALPSVFAVVVERLDDVRGVGAADRVGVSVGDRGIPLDEPCTGGARRRRTCGMRRLVLAMCRLVIS